MNNKKREKNMAKLILCIQTVYGKISNKTKISRNKSGVNTQKAHRQLIAAFLLQDRKNRTNKFEHHLYICSIIFGKEICLQFSPRRSETTFVDDNVLRQGTY